MLAGAEYGSGSSRDWAAKGPMLLVSPLLYVHIFWFVIELSFLFGFFEM